MGINRRSFFKTMGAVGGTLTLGKTLQASTKPDENDIEFSGILFDSTLCVGCQSCEYACAETYELPSPEDMPEMGLVRKTDDTRRITMNSFDTSRGVMFMRTACNHCNSPACASACLTKAMVKTDEGPVIWRESKCMGCRSCIISCPFDIPKFEYNSPNPKIQKCRMCFEGLQQGEQPACVESCPAGALTFGKRRDLIEIARERIYADPENYNHHIYGEHEVGGTGVLYLASVPFEELGLRTDLGTTAYPEYNKTFLYSVPAVLVLWPAFLLGLRNASIEKNSNKQIEE